MSHPRQFVVGGTINPGANGYLRDVTGNRRFWPVKCGIGWEKGRTVDVPRLCAVVEQLHAEARVAYEAKEPWWLEDRRLTELQEAATEQRAERDVWHDAIASFVDDKEYVTVAAVMGVGGALNIQVKDQSLTDAKRVGSILRSLGFEQTTKRIDGQPTRVFVRPRGHGNNVTEFPLAVVAG
jgi:predicted P-loop ATPase